MLLETISLVRDLPRLHEISSILIRYGGGDLVRRLGVGGMLERAGRVLHWKESVEIEHLDPSQRFRQGLEELGPTFIKLGQVLATRVDLFPPNWIAELEKLQASAPALPFEQLLPQMKAALKGLDPHAVFDNLNTTPRAAASIAQVYEANLKDGTPIIIKVRRPGIEPKIEADLRIMSHIARMVEVGFLDAAAAEKARGAALGAHASAGGRTSPWAVDLAGEEVEAGDEGRVSRDALVVDTTIQPQVQRLAEAALAEGLKEVLAAHPKLSGVQAALIAVRARDGAIVAMVGGRDYGDSAFNRVVNSPRQVGSTVKPLTLIAAFEADPALSPATVFTDAAIERTVDGKSWAPTNYDHTWAGDLPLRAAIAKSRNIPAVLLAERVGLQTLKTRLGALGLSRATAYPSVALGGFSATPSELAGAYTVFAAEGAYHAPYLLRSVLKDDQVAADYPPAKATIRYSERATFLAYDVLHSVMTEGTGKAAATYGVGPGAAGKTGTTDDYSDAWFAGVSGPYAVVVWVGYDHPKPLGLTGGQAALPIWARFVDAVGFDVKGKSPPTGVVSAEVCLATGAAPCADCAETRTEWFTEGTVPEGTCGIVPEAAEAVKDGWQKIGELFGLNR